METNNTLTVANEILAQLGGSRFMTMTGAHSFVGDANSLTFCIRKNRSKASMMRVTLLGDDTYRVEAFRIASQNYTVNTVASHDGIQAETLAPVFTLITGQEVRL
jgi:hypothetical protein